MFYGQCNTCGQRWKFGTANTCTCEQDDEFNRIEREASMRKAAVKSAVGKHTIDMAREAWLDTYGLGKDHISFVEALKRFAELVRAEEREACAKVCDDFERAKWESVKNISENGGRLAFAGPMHCAKAIRARGEASIRGNT